MRSFRFYSLFAAWFAIQGCAVQAAPSDLPKRHVAVQKNVAQRPASGMENNTVLTPREAASAAHYARLLEQLRSTNAAQRTCAATDLGRIDGRRNETVAHLSFILKNDSSKWVRRAAAKSLGRIGTREVVAPLTAALSDRDKWVAHSAANALQQVRRRA